MTHAGDGPLPRYELDEEGRVLWVTATISPLDRPSDPALAAALFPPRKSALPPGQLAIGYVDEPEIGLIVLKRGPLPEVEEWRREWKDRLGPLSRPETGPRVLVFEPVPQAIKTLNALLHGHLTLERLLSRPSEDDAWS